MTLRLNGSTSGYTEIDSPAVGANNTLVLPTGNGSSGQVLTTNGSGTLSWTGMGPAFSVYANTTQSISSLVATKVLLNTEEYDTASAFDSTTNYRFQPGVAGYYQLNGVIRAAAGNTLTNAYSEIWKNGSAWMRGQELAGSFNVGPEQVTISCLMFFNGTSDYVELYGVIGAVAPSFQYASVAFTSRLSGFLARPA